MPCAGTCAVAEGGRAVGVAAGGAGRGGIATAGGVAIAAGVLAVVSVVLGVAGGAGVFGGMTTTAGGRIAATEAGVTSRGAGVSTVGFAGAAGFTATGAGASGLASTGGAGATGFGAGGLTTGRAEVCSAASFCCVMARRTSPGREMCERSILVLMPSSWLGAFDDLAPADAPSPRPPSALRTSSASWSSSELECVFFSVTPTSASTSRIALLLTSSSRARSLIRIFIRSLFSFSCPALVRLSTLRSHL